MLYIDKTREPYELLEWRMTQKNLGANFGYDDMPGNIKSVLKSSLLQEQFYLCGYTGLRILEEKCHIEHLIPRSVSINAGRIEETTNYRNLIACDNSSEFGAVFKGNWPSDNEAQDFLMPTDSTCQDRINYLNTGKVEANNPNDVPPRITIEKLNLNHKDLVKNRKDSFLNLFADISPKDYKRYIRKRIEKLQNKSSGQLEEFSLAKIQFLKRKQ